MVTLWRLLPRNLWALRAQAGAMALLVMCGVALLVSSWSAYLSLKKAQETYYKNHRMADVYATLKRAPVPLSQRIAALPGVALWETRLTENLLLDVPGQTEPALGHFVSLPASGAPRLHVVHLRSGRPPRPRATPPEAIVHEAFALAHGLRPGDTLSGLFRGQRASFRIAGVGLSPEFVYALNPAVLFPDNKHFGVFWMPRPDLEKLLSMDGAFNDVVLTLRRGASAADTRAALDRLLKPYGGLGAIDRSDQLSHRLVSDEIRQQKTQAVFNPTVFLSVAAFLIHLLLSRLVALQRGILATLKSLGYRDREIGATYVALALAMALLGVLPGLALGAGLGSYYANVYRDFFRFPALDFSLSPAALGLGVAAGLGPAFLGAVSSVRSILRLAPAEALRPASPAEFRLRWGRDVPGIGFFPPDERLILRGWIARPLRSVLTVLGMAAAMAIVINGGFWRDTLDRLLHVQFNVAYREDVTVSFLDPRPRGVLRELRALPGVTTAEGLRSVGARLRWGSVTQDLSVLGVSPDTTLRPPQAPHVRSVPPTTGILLTRDFEERHGLRPGDRVELEFLEGARPRRSVSVAGFTEDMVGSGGVMRDTALHRLLGEKPVHNTALLRVAPGRDIALSARLKERPQSAAVQVKSLLLRGFRETIAGMIQVFTWILIAFAVAIAAGVIYNTGHVILSERSRELAGLRVLGFSSRALWSLVFTDVAVPVFLALLPGAGLGLFLSWLSAQLVHTDQFRFPLKLSGATYALGAVVLLSTLVLVGLDLWRKVRRLDWTEVLKSYG